jgi:hypothetical protein
MKPEAQRIAIAEACGWRNSSDGIWWMHASNDLAFRKPPDYLNDLNAMHEAEGTMGHETATTYNAWVRRLVLNWSWHATAAQRAEAFLRTIGKWQEQPQEQTA